MKDKESSGRLNRDMICERDSQPDMAQTMHLISGSTIASRISGAEFDSTCRTEEARCLTDADSSGSDLSPPLAESAGATFCVHKPPKLQTSPLKTSPYIHLWLAGGLSHLDTFDMKAEADRKYRSAFKPIPTSVPGLHISEHLPRTAKLMNQVTLIRSMTHKQSAHGAAQTLMLSGHDALPTLLVPSIGSVLAKELGPRNELPPYVVIPQPRGNNARAGFLGPKYNPFSAGEVNVPKYSVRDMDLPMSVDWARMESRHSLLKLVDSNIRAWDTSDTFDTLDSYYQSAFELMRSPRAKKAFQIAEEPDALQDKYGRTAMGQGCLLCTSSCRSRCPLHQCR